MRASFFRAMLVIVCFVPDGARATPQFVPPYGLSLDTPLGTARNADGSGVVTFRTMQRDMEKNAKDLADLAGKSLTQDRLDVALESYLPRSGGTVTGGLKVAGTTELSDAIIHGLSLFSAADAKVVNGLHLDGQGMVMSWNNVANGRGATELINVNPGTFGGFRFYDLNTGSTLTSDNAPLFDLSPAGGIVFSGLAGTDNAFICVRASGQLFRSDAPCR